MMYIFLLNVRLHYFFIHQRSFQENLHEDSHTGCSGSARKQLPKLSRRHPRTFTPSSQSFHPEEFSVKKKIASCKYCFITVILCTQYNPMFNFLNACTQKRTHTPVIVCTQIHTSNYTLGHSFYLDENLRLHKNVHTSVHSSAICKRQKLKKPLPEGYMGYDPFT